MLYSPSAVVALEQGGDYMPPGSELREPFRGLVEREQRIVLLGTGSPQLDYVLVVHLETSATSAALTGASSTRFGMFIEGTELLVRDGYDRMDRSTSGDSARSVPLPDAYYTVDAFWVPDRSDNMIVNFFFRTTDVKVPGNGWPFLGYRVRPS